jgi:hypothetical protein
METFLRQALEDLHLSHNRYILFAGRPLKLLPSRLVDFLITWDIPFIEKPLDLERLEALIQLLAK